MTGAGTTILRSQGFRVLRFWNNDIRDNPDGVYRVICDALRALTPTPDPSPYRGGRPRNRKLRTGLKNLAARTGDKGTYSQSTSLPSRGRVAQSAGWGSATAGFAVWSGKVARSSATPWAR